MFLNIVFVALGGAIGSVCRYLTGLLVVKLFGTGFAWGTLAANLAGCLIIGVILGLLSRDLVSPEFRAFFVVGFLGGLTTFSSYAAETITFFKDGLFLKAGINILLNNVAGLVLAFAGFVFMQKKT